MAAGSNPFNIDFTLVLFNVWFAFVILFRDSFDSPHPQGSWSLDRICLAMVPWFGGHPSFPTPPAITMPAMLFEPSPCPVFNHALLLVWPVTGLGVPTLLKIIHFFPPSDCPFVLRTNFLPSLFQALTTSWGTMCFEAPTWRVNCI